MARTTKADEEQRNFKNEVRNIAQKEAKKVVKRASIAPDYTEDDPDLDTDDLESPSFSIGLDDDDEPMIANGEDRFASIRTRDNSNSSSSDDDDVDIFDRFNKCVDFPVKFTIQKNGELLAKKDAPYSWDQVQEEYGGGMYKIIAKNGLNGRMLKHESKSVAQPKVSEKKVEAKLAAERESVRDILSTVNSQFSESLSSIQESNEKNAQLLAEALKNEKEERRRLEERQREEAMEIKKAATEAGNSTNTLLTTLLPLLLKKDDGGNTTNMMLEIQKMNMEQQKETQKLIMEIQKENREESRRLQEATNNMISKMLTDLKPKESKPDFDALTIMKMMQDAESKGMEKMKEFMDLADERAERRMEEMNNDKPDKDEGGVIQNTLKMLLPVLVQQGMGKGMPTAIAAPEERLIQSHRPQQNAALPTNVTTQKPRPVQKPVETKARVLAQPINTQVTNVKAAQTTKTVDSTPKQTTINVEAAKEQIITIATPILGEAFQSYLQTQSFDPKATADKTIAALSKQGISARIAVQCVSAEDIISTCHGYGLASAETDQLLRQYYENIKTSASAS